MINLEDLLNYIDPSDLSYDEWLKVGQALHYEGFTIDVWTSWSWRDPGRASKTNFQAKWDSFDDSIANPVTAGTIYKIAVDHGYVSNKTSENKAWDVNRIAPIYNKKSLKRNDNFEFKESNADETIEFINALGLADDDYLPFCDVGLLKTNPKEALNYEFTVRDIISFLSQDENNKKVSEVLTAYDETKGMYISINAFDGKGKKENHVVKWLNTLIECDPDKNEFYSQSENKQKEELTNQINKIKEINLPYRAITYSGGKSIHAIVRVDAKNQNEYNERVKYIHDFCKKNGLNIDTSTKDASRFTRMPGAKRGDRWQFLIETNPNATNYENWANENNELSYISLAQIAERGIMLQPKPIIHGILRKGGKMILSARSKSGKTQLTLELALALSTGEKWLNYQCEKSKTLFLDFEMGQANIENRLYDICNHDIKKFQNSNLFIYSFKGSNDNAEEIADKIIHENKKIGGFDAIIIDPTYKLLTGSESNAEDVTKYLKLLDQISKESNNASIIYTHHHRKVQQGNQTNYDFIEDMISGSGVFLRDCDALILITTELKKTPSEIIQEEVNKTLWIEALKEYNPDIEFQPKTAEEACSLSEVYLTKEQRAEVRNKFNLNYDYRVQRIISILRSFPNIKDSTRLVFNYPRHICINLPEDKEFENINQKDKRREEKKKKIDELRQYLEEHEVPIKINKLADLFSVSEKSIRNYINEISGFEIRDGKVADNLYWINEDDDI